ncbi:RNA polymerase I-specific transcription initiation factor RRN3 [Nymphon striatum]|nr:RNA polymerase I-specific transcription initiation factor RRN3 [Nymphon striatum]
MILILKKMLITCVKSNDTTNTVEDLKFAGILQNDLNCYIAPSGFLVPKYPIAMDEELESVFVQLRDNIFVFDKENEKFIQFLLKVSWSGRNQKTIEAYQDLIINLVSAHTNYLASVIQMLISHFLPRRDSQMKCEFPSEEEKCSFAHVHFIIRKIVNIVPSTPPVLLKTIQDRVPYFGKETYLHVCYLQNLLTICQYCEKIRKDILGIIVVSLLQLDVNSSPQDIIEAEKVDENSDDEDNEDLFVMETEDNQVEDHAKNVNTVSDSMKHPIANTLDCVMKLMFEFIHDVCYSSSDELNWEASKKLYKEFLAIFDTCILPTLGCAHIQYLVFYILSLKAPLYEGFLDYLWEKVQNPNSSSIIRQAAVAYISSLLARAKFIPIGTVMSCFDVMCPWIHSYVNNQEGSSKVTVDAAFHGCFYSVCQAVFYVFAFRHKELTDFKKGLTYLKSLNFERVISSRLNPLKICLPVVVKNFANVARNFQIAYCYTIIERNNRNNLPIAIESGGAGDSWRQVSKLTPFFPFDPYLLQSSSTYINSIYRTYEGNVEAEESNENDDEDDFLDAHEQSMTSQPQNPKLSGNIDEYFSYKLSPGFKQMFSPPKH